MAVKGTKTEILVDENGVEILITYNYEKVEEGTDVELISVEMVIAGKGIELLALLNDQQKSKITEQITF